MITPIADATPRSVVASIFLLITGIKKSQYLCRFSDFKVRTKFLIGHHEILKRYGTHFGPIYGIAGFEQSCSHIITTQYRCFL